MVLREYLPRKLQRGLQRIRHLPHQNRNTARHCNGSKPLPPNHLQFHSHRALPNAHGFSSLTLLAQRSRQGRFAKRSFVRQSDNSEDLLSDYRSKRSPVIR